MAIQTVTPFQLQQALADARRRGGPSDYYGLGAAFNQFGNAYGDLAHNVVSANDAIRSNELTNAQLASGYYPLQQEGIASDIRGRIYNNQQQMAVKQAVEEAHQIAAQQGLQAGTPQYQLFMRNYLSQHGPYNAAMGAVPAADKATTQLQNEYIAKSFIKKSLETYAAREYAQEYVAQKSANQTLTPEAAAQLQKEAQDFAQQHVLSLGLDVGFNDDGSVKVTDKTGVEHTVPPDILSEARAIMGDAGPMKILQQITDAYLKDKATTARVTKETTPTPVRAPAAAAGKPVPNPLLDRLQHLEKMESQLAGKGENADKTVLKEYRDEINMLRDKLYGTAKGASAYDPNSVIAAASGNVAAPGVPTENQLSNPYGYMPEEGPDTSAFYTTMPPDVYGQAAPPIPTQPSLMNRAMQLAPNLAPTAVTGE